MSSRLFYRAPHVPGRQMLAPAVGIALLVLLTGAVSCGGNSPPKQFNRSASLTSIGPVTFNGTSVQVDYTLRDAEGDDASVYVGVCEGTDPGDSLCPTPVEGAESDGLSSLPTVPKGQNVSHVFAWNVGCGRVGSGSCLKTKVGQTYVFRIRLEGTNETVVSKGFSLGDTFKVKDVPSCDESAGSIPQPCPPGDGGSQ